MTAPYLPFARRLHRALDLAGFAQGRSRTGALSRHYDVSRETARKWLSGLALPELERMIALAVNHNVNFEWLATGRGHMRSDDLGVREPAPSYVDREEMIICSLIRQLSPKRRRAILDLLEPDSASV